MNKTDKTEIRNAFARLMPLPLFPETPRSGKIPKQLEKFYKTINEVHVDTKRSQIL